MVAISCYFIGFDFILDLCEFDLSISERIVSLGL